MRQKIGPIISQEAEKFLRQNFENLNAGATYCLDALPGLYARTLHGLKGKFTRGELMLMIDVMNGTFLTAGLSGQHLEINVRDGIDLDKLDQKWEVDGPALNAKLAGLPIFEAACLEIWIGAFWRQEDHNVEEYTGRLLNTVEKGSGEKWVSLDHLEIIQGESK